MEGPEKNKKGGEKVEREDKIIMNKKKHELVIKEWVFFLWKKPKEGQHCLDETRFLGFKAHRKSPNCDRIHAN